MYDFSEQLGKGEAAEQFLDNHYAQFFDIEKVGRDEQRVGIDRFFKREGRVWPIEYKADWAASKTGNAFVETISVDTANTPGWAYTSKAEWLLYFLPSDGVVYIVQMEKLRKNLDKWAKMCKERAIPNQGYSTRGLLVPLDLFEQVAHRVDSV